MPTIFESSDADLAHEMLNQMYGRMCLTVTGTRHLIRAVREPVGVAELQRITLRMGFRADAPPPGTLLFTTILTGAVGGWTGRHRRGYRAGETYLTALPEEGFRAFGDALDAEFVVIPPSLVNETADRPVTFTGYDPIGPGADLWLRTCAHARSCAADSARAPLLGAHLARLLAAAALDTFPNDALRDPTIEDRHDAHPATVRRAAAFIDENAQRDISLADIAAAAGVTIRAVQFGFRRHLDETPLTYLRRVRLEHAHDELAAADPAIVTVRVVAARWGFPKHSHFSALYREAYGRPPCETLRS